MRSDRLLELADLLDSIPAEKFDFDSIFVNGTIDSAEEAESCGTVGCALGWANTVPSFRAAGYKLTSGSWEQASNAAQRLFDIGYQDVHHLFMPDVGGLQSGAPPSAVADLIREFVEEHS